MDDRSRGLYQKFKVVRVDGGNRRGEKHEYCQYFVLDLNHDPHAIPALRSYAESAEKDGYAELAKDLRAAADFAESEKT